VLSFYFFRKTTSHSPYTAMLSPKSQPCLRFFSEAAIKAGFFSTSEPNPGT
jgi:hypothetical protein